MKKIVLIVHNVRSCHNVGSLLRTADGLGVELVYLTGYTPYPASDHDQRLPHEAQKIQRQIHKTALGAENSVAWRHVDSALSVAKELREQDYKIVALEQSPKAIDLPSLRSSAKTALVVGREIGGIEPKLLTIADQIVEIPMSGSKESFNVAVAAGMALYKLRFG